MSQQFPRETWLALSKSMQRNLCRGRSRVRKLAVERLEDRQLMAGDVAVNIDEVAETVYLPEIKTIDIGSVADPVSTEVDVAQEPSHTQDIRLDSEPFQLPMMDWRRQRPLTLEEQVYFHHSEQKSELTKQQYEQRQADFELINRLDPQPSFIATGYHGWRLSGDIFTREGEFYLGANFRQFLRIGDNLYFQTIRPGNLGDIAVFNGETITYLGFNIPLTSYVGHDGATMYDVSKLPDQFGEFQGKLFFMARTPELGRELYSYDGERVQVYDLTPGAASSSIRGLSGEAFVAYGSFTTMDRAYDPERSSLTVVQGTLYLHIRRLGGSELLRFDGTQWSSMNLSVDFFSSSPLPDGSLLVQSTKGGWPDYEETAYLLTGEGLQKIGGDDFALQSAYVLEGQLYVIGHTAEFGTELYRWNGTELEVLDLTPGADSTVDLPKHLQYSTIYKDPQGHLILNNINTRLELGDSPSHYFHYGNYIDIGGTNASIVYYRDEHSTNPMDSGPKFVSRTELGERSFQKTGLGLSDLPFAELDPNAIELELVSEVVTPPEGLIHGTAYPPMEFIDVVTNNPIELPEIGETPPAPEETSVAPPETISETPVAPPAKADEEESNMPLVMVVDVPATELPEAPQEEASDASDSIESLDAVFTSVNTSLIDNTLIDPFVSHSGDDQGSSDDDLFAEDAAAEDLLGESV